MFRTPPDVRALCTRAGIGLLWTAAASLMRAVLDPLLGTGTPYLPYFLAVAVAAWHGGRLAGGVSVVSGALAAAYFFVPPRYSLLPQQRGDWVAFLAFLALGSGLAAFVARWRRTEAALLRARSVLDQAGEIARLGAWETEYVEGEAAADSPLYWSDGTYRIFGYQPGAVRVTNRLFFSHVHPEDRKRLTEAVREAVKHRSAYSVEHRIVRRDGLERVVLEHAVFEAVPGEHGLRMVGAVQDVTDQRQSEREVRATSERLRRIVEHIHDALIIDDRQGRIVFANDRFLEMFGFERSQLGTLSLEDYVSPEWRQALRERHDRRVRGEQVPEHFEYEGVSRDGQPIWLEVDVVPVLNERGVMVGTQSALRDVTFRKRAEESLRASEETARRRAEELERLMAQREQLEGELRRKADELAEANRLKDEFIATVSHELRTPLNAMLGWAELLRERRLEQAAEERALQVIANNARRQAQLVEELLDMSRIVAGKLRLDPAIIDPVLPIHAALEAVMPSAHAKGLSIAPPSPTGTALVFADPARLQQIVWNLLTNAVKFTPSGGRIGVEVLVRNGQVDIEVRDTGVGIAPSFLPYVFDRFRQADSRSTRAHGGLGIGLSIVRHLVEAQGGQVRVQSEGENKGATFVVTLPLQRVEHRRRGGAGAAPSRALPAPPALPAPDLAGVRVLAVDDEPDACELVALVLGQRGAEVTTAESGEAALRALSISRPDLLVIDIAMPGIDGYMLLDRIRARGKECSLVPAIALTAFAREDDRRRALQAGFSLHLAKPVEEHALLHAVADVLGPGV